MRYTVQVAGREHVVEITETADGLTAQVGDRPARPARLVPSPAPLHVLELGETRATLAIEPVVDEAGRWSVALEGRPPVEVEAVDARFAKVLQREAGASRRLKQLKSPMPGVIIELCVEAGQEVTQGQVLLILEAMKMQNEIRAEGDGTVKSVKVSVGDSVPARGLLIDFA